MRTTDPAATISAISAERVRLSSGERRVFPATSFTANSGSLVAILGASGTGKTALLLTLSGRMRGWRGSASVCGFDLAREARGVRGVVGVGLIVGVNDLTEALTPRQHVVEQRAFVRRSKRAPHVDVLARVGLDSAADVPVRHLDAEQRSRLGIALALVRNVRALVVDDLDRDLNCEERQRMVGLLRALCGEGLTCLVACVDENIAAQADVAVALEGLRALPKEETRDAVA